MRIGTIGLLAAMASLPTLALAQTSFTPLPPVPAMQPLYPIRPVARAIERPVRPIAYVAPRGPVAVAVRATSAVVAPPPAPKPQVVASLALPPVAVPTPAPEPVLATRTDLPELSRGLLPANTPVLLRLDEEVNSDGRKAGDSFRMTVMQDVVLAGAIAIPRGAPAFGTVTWRTGKGGFGKSGKIAITVDRVEFAGRIVPLLGEFREEGKGKTGLTIGMAVAAGLVAAAFVKGQDAAFHAGREIRAATRDALPVDLPDVPPSTAPQVAVVAR